MSQIEVLLDNDIDVNEFKKVVGFISQEIVDYKIVDNVIYVELKDPKDSEDIANQIRNISKKYISNSGVDKIVFECDREGGRYFEQFDSIHYFDDGMIALTDESKFLYHYFEDMFYKFVIQNFSEDNCDIITKIYPVLLPIDAYKKTGYLKRTPQYSIFCCSLCEDLKLLEEVKNVKDGNYKLLLNNPKYSLSPSACFHVYEELKDRVLRNNTIVTFTQSVFRNEGRFNYKEFGRMRDYHVREIVFIGDDDFVRKSREKIINITQKYIEQLKLKANLAVASDPFILPRMQKYKKMQIIDSSKYELKLYYSNNRDMSVASFNLHGTAFTQPFNFSVDGKNTVTGCVGYGLERFVLCFLSQYGECVENWPSDVRKKYESRLN